MVTSQVADKQCANERGFFCPWADGLWRNLTCLPVLLVLFYQNMIFTSPDNHSSCVWWFSYQFLMQYDMLRAVCQLPCFISIVQLKKKKKNHVLNLLCFIYLYLFDLNPGYFPYVIFFVSLFWLKKLGKTLGVENKFFSRNHFEWGRTSLVCRGVCPADINQRTMYQERHLTAEGSGFHSTPRDFRDHKLFCIVEPKRSHLVTWYYELSEIQWWLVTKSFMGGF